MKNDTQLLCTFVAVDELSGVVEHIKKAYALVFNKIYVLENVDDPTQLVLTYNVVKSKKLTIKPPPSTISVHRKKQTNTIYTINAINRLTELKIGRIDPSYKVDWEELENCVLVTAYGELKVVSTRLLDIIETAS